MKFLRFRYILPFSLFVVSGLSMIAYAAIIFDDDVVGIWYWPNNTPDYTDPKASFEKNLNFDDYICPAPVPTWCVSNCGGPGGWGGDPMDPIIITPSLPPPSTGYQSDSF